MLIPIVGIVQSFYFFHELTQKIYYKHVWWKGKYETIDRALESVDSDFELSDLSVTDMFSKLHSALSQARICRPPPPLRSGYLYVKDAQCDETIGKIISQIFPIFIL